MFLFVTCFWVEFQRYRGGGGGGGEGGREGGGGGGLFGCNYD
jgi:hypothetical protein